MIPDPKIVGLYEAILGDQHGLEVRSPGTSAPASASDGLSLAQQRKAAMITPCSPHGRTIDCKCDYRGPQCRAKVLGRQCDPPRDIRVAFGEGYKGKVNLQHLRIASGAYRDAKDGC